MLIWILNNEDPTILRYLCQYLLSTTIWLNGIGDLQTGWPALSMRKNIFFLASSLDAHCWLCKSSDPFPCSKQYSFHINMAGLHLDTSRTLFLLASTQGVSCRLVMNHLIYMYMFSLITHPLIYMWVSVCTFMCIYLFSCPSVSAPQLLIFHREYLFWCIVVVYQS